MKRLALSVVALVSIGTSGLFAVDSPDGAPRNWHQWRGPLATGEAPQADPPVHWDAETNIRWKIKIPGRSSATPILWEDRVFTLSALQSNQQLDKSVNTASAQEPQDLSRQTPESFQRGPESPQRSQNFPRRGRRPILAPSHSFQFWVHCVDRKTGEILWQKMATERVPHAGHHSTNTYASASPVTDGKSLYVSFGSNGIYCYDLDGELKWSRDLGDMQTRRNFGEASSPVLYRDTLIVNWDHEGPSFLVALDAETGKTRWQVDRDEVTTWGTPLVVTAFGRDQVIVNGTKRTRSYDAATGELIWECGGQASNPCSTPVVHEGVVYCMTGRRGYVLKAISLDALGDVTDTRAVVWSKNKATPYVPTAALVDGRLWFTKSNTAILSCLDAKSGDPILDQVRVPKLGNLYASPVAAAGKIYFTDREGTTVVLKLGDRLEILATNHLDEPVDASPAMVGDSIYMRSEQHLYCIATAR